MVGRWGFKALKHMKHLEQVVSETAIAIFACDRPEHLNRMLNSLIRNIDLDCFAIFIFVDFPRTKSTMVRHGEVLELIRNFQKKFEVVSVQVQSSNLGLASSVRQGVELCLTNFTKVIVLEDDLVLSVNYLNYMTLTLAIFEENEKIGSISGYTYSQFPFFVKRNLIATLRHSSWGWATWKDRWIKIDWSLLSNDSKMEFYLQELGKISPDLPGMLIDLKNNRVDSWAILFNLNMAILDMRALHPRYSLVSNIGGDGSGTNVRLTKIEKVFYENEISPMLLDLEDFSISRWYDWYLAFKHSRWYPFPYSFFVVCFLYFRRNIRKIRKYFSLK